MDFDIKKYKGWYWCETSGAYTRYFSEINDAEEMPFEFAKEVIKGCDGLIEVDGKPNHYHKCYNGSEFFFEYVIYAFNDKQIFEQVIKEFEEYFNFGRIFKFANISEKYFLEKSKEDIIEDKNVIKCSQWIIDEMLDLNEDYGITLPPISFKKYLVSSLNVLVKNNKDDYTDNLINVCKDILFNNKFMRYYKFLNLRKKLYEETI